MAAVVLGGKLGACGAPGELGKGADSGAETLELQVPGLDPSSLTGPEHRNWVAFVSELSAPCADLEVTLKQCVTEKLSCPSCVPAARFLYSEVRRGKTAAQIEAAYDLRFSPERVRQLDLAGAPRKGAPHAVVLIAEWADFECSACGMVSPLLDAELKAYPEYLALAFLHYPLVRHERAEPASRAAIAAAWQGRFWRMHDLMYQNQQLLGAAGLLKLARQAGLDLERFEADRTSERARQQVARDRAQADALGLTGTPMLYINGRLFDFDHFSVLDDLDEWIRLEVEIRTGQRVQPRPVDMDAWLDPDPDAQPGSSSRPAAGPPDASSVGQADAGAVRPAAAGAGP